MQMKRFFLCVGAVCCLAAAPYKPTTVRQPAHYLATDAAAVEDTCPGQDIFTPFTCTKQTPPGYTCFDVYIVQGDPIAKERYTLLDQTLTTEQTSPEPRCTFQELTCEHFLEALAYNLDFSWFITNFPSSSFPACAETYSCTRIACLLPDATSTAQHPVSKKLSCVFKKNQTFFLGTNVTCQDKKAARTAQ